MPSAATTPTRRALSLAATIAAFVVVFVSTVLSTMGVPLFREPGRLSPSGGPMLNDLGTLVSLLCVLLSLAIFWRHGRPWVVFGLGAFVALVLQSDPLLMLLGMSELVGRRRGREWRPAAAGAAVVSAVVVARNAAYHDFDEIIRVQGAALVLFHSLVGLAAYAAAFGLGWLRRSRRDLEHADARVELVEQRAEGLSHQLSQQSERELLAREIHDALAHRLSLVSLHSGALEEAVRSGDPHVAEAAQVVRDNAHRSLEDLRDLIGALRNPYPAAPLDEPHQIPLHGMADVADVIDSTAAAGVAVNAFVMLCDPDDASELLNRAVFRLVQESLTNVVKHAPGTTVGLDLRASPTRGVTLRVRNRLLGGPTGMPESGAGIIGMRERVGALGGRFSAGPTADGWFEVIAEMPWRSAVSDHD